MVAFQSALVLFLALNLSSYVTSSTPPSPLSSSPSLSSSSGSSSGSACMLLRVRKVDGSIERVSVPLDAQDSTILSDVLASASGSGSGSGFGSGSGSKSEYLDKSKPEYLDKSKIRCEIGSNRDIDVSRSISSLGLKHGSLVSIVAPAPETKQARNKEPSASEHTSASSKRYCSFEPYPDLAKTSSYTAAARRQRALSRLPNRRGTSYSQISKLQSNMHTIEPQSQGPIKRIYMCQQAAERFKDSCSPTATNGRAHNRCALLFGTRHKERLDQNARLVRTSLSTPLHEAKMCTVLKVHALWEPKQRPDPAPGPYDARGLAPNDPGEDTTLAKDFARAIEVAEMLGLTVVGWMYSYSEDRAGGGATNSEEDALPVWGRDVVTGAIGQILNMERIGNEDGCNFVTLAMDAHSGATEAFQLSDVSVQMIAEGVLPFTSTAQKNTLGGRLVTTNEPIVIDGKETTELDCVLCLVNTAMLSHMGRYAGKDRASATKKGGKGLTSKSKKRILETLQRNGTGENDAALVQELCDFNLLIVLDRLLGKNDTRDLCKLVSKYTRGQKKGITVPKQIKLLLKSILEG